MIWPEPMKEYQGVSTFNNGESFGWNACLEACRLAYEKEPKLVALDELKLTEFLLPTYEDDSIDNVYEDDSRIAARKYIRVRSIVHDVCSKFGTPSLPKNKCIVCEQEACVFQQENGWRCQNHALFGS